MGYDILYSSQFIRSSEGITAAILIGNSDAYEDQWCGNHWNSRRYREWQCLFNQVAISVEDFMKEVQKLPDGDIWYQKGKGISKEKVIRWAKRGVQKAATIEEIIAANPPARPITCSLFVWTGNHQMEQLREAVTTTAQFDAWVMKAKSKQAELASLQSAFCVKLWEKLKHPIPLAITQDVCIRYRNLYLKQYDGVRETIWTKYAKDAMRMTYPYALQLTQTARSRWIHSSAIVNPPNANQPYDAVIYFEGKGRGPGSGGYVAQISQNMVPCYTAQMAWRYADVNAARRAIKKLAPRFPHLEFSVKQLPQTEQNMEK